MNIYMDSCFSTKVQRHFSRERRFFSANDAKTEYTYTYTHTHKKKKTGKKNPLQSIYYGLNYFPPKKSYVEVLTPSTSGCDCYLERGSLEG